MHVQYKLHHSSRKMTERMGAVVVFSDSVFQVHLGRPSSLKQGRAQMVLGERNLSPNASK